MRRFPVCAGSNEGGDNREPLIGFGQPGLHIFVTAALLATATFGVSAGERTSSTSIDRADQHGVRHRPAEALLERRIARPARGFVTSSEETPTWEFLGVWGGEVDTVAESPADADLVFAGVGPGNLMLGGLYRSTDRGATWRPVAHSTLSRVPVDAIAFEPNGTIYVGTAWNLWKSTDDGETWLMHDIPGTRDWVRSLVIDPTAPSTVWISAGAQIFRSTDGGENWTEKTPPLASRTCHAIALDPTNTDRVFVGHSDIYGSSSRFYVSNDGGESWVDRSPGLPDNPILDIAHDGDRVLVVGGIAYADQPFGLFASTDLGITWMPLHDSTWPVLYVSDVEVDPMNANRILLATDDGVFRSEDGGTSWEFGVGDTGPMTVRSVRFSPNNTGRVLAGEETRGVLVSEDSGTDFEISSTGINKLYVNSTASNPLDPQEIAIAYQGLNSGGVYVSRDGGKTWLQENCPGTRYNRVVFSPTGALHAISSGPTTVATEGLYRRDSDGTWIHLGPDQGSFFDTDLRSMRFSTNDPRLILSAGKDSGYLGYEATIWRSADGGTSWNKAFESAEPERVVTDIDIVKDGADTEMLASWITLDSLSGGMLRSIDGGHTWDEPVQDVPSDAVPVALSPSARGTEVFFVADAGQIGGLLVTEDGGRSWSRTGFTGTRVWDVVSHPSRIDRLFIATSDTPTVSMSDDGGDLFMPFDAGLDSAGYPVELGLSHDSPPRLLLSTTDGSFFRVLGNPAPRSSGDRVSP